jgi:hypothetical protein
MKFDRISSYQIEGYFQSIAKLQYLKLQDYILMPVGINIDGENEINILIPKKTSLYDLLHSSGISKPIETVSMKLSICLRIARILNTLHSLSPAIAHGSINRYNIFIDNDF